jgi:hypothetical protein
MLTRISLFGPTAVVMAPRRMAEDAAATQACMCTLSPLALIKVRSVSTLFFCRSPSCSESSEEGGG